MTNPFESENLGIAAQQLRRAAETLDQIAAGQEIPNVFHGTFPWAAEFLTPSEAREAVEMAIKDAKKCLGI